MQQQKINFRQERDFGGVLGDSLTFLKQNFRSFFASVICIVGPLILLMGLLYAYIQTTMLNNIQTDPSNPFGRFNGDYFMSIGSVIICGFLSNILLSSVSYNYMCLYNEKAAGEKITVSEVATKLWNNIGRLVISAIVFLLTIILVLTILTLICIGMFTGLGVGGAVFIGLTVFFSFIIFIPILSYLVPASFYLVVRDNVFIYSAIGTTRKYLSGNFWWTWLIMVVVFISLFVLQTLFNLPATVITMMKVFNRSQESGDNSVLMMTLYTVGMFLTYCTYSITQIISAFNFMSHEEKYEGKGLQSKIEEIV